MFLFFEYFADDDPMTHGGFFSNEQDGQGTQGGGQEGRRWASAWQHRPRRFLIDGESQLQA